MMNYPSLMFLDKPSGELMSPEVFEDLKLNLLISPHVVESMRPVCGKDDILARQEMFRAMQDEELRSHMKALSEDMDELFRLYEAYSESACEDERRVIYVSLLKAEATFVSDAGHGCASGTFIDRFNAFFADEIKRPAYEELAADVERVLPHINDILEVSFKVMNDNLHITSEIKETYIDKLARCAKNLGLPEISEARDFSRPLPADIVEAVAALYPEAFDFFDWFSEKYAGFFNEEIMRYRGELAFYLELSDIFDKLRGLGIPVTCPTVSEEKRMDVKDAYDITLLAKDERNIVPNDIDLSMEEPFFYLTGANGGGKTTYLRAVGCAAVLFHSGCPMACRSAEMSPFKNIYTHFPRDERFDSDGRFADENTRVNAILEVEGGNSLILLNETYSATSEELAVPLTVALAEKLYKSGSFGIYITHQHGVGKTKIPFLNVVVDINDENRRTYKISKQKGDMGSMALDILKKYNLDRESLTARFGGVEDEVQSAL